MDPSNSEPTKFDPKLYLIKVKGGADYLEVKYRLQWLRSEYPYATISTNLEEHTRGSEQSVAVFSATVSFRDTATLQFASATGWGMEESTDFGDYLEKAETKALGRALAALGFGTQFCEDWSFGAENDRVVDAPVKRNTSPRPASRGTLKPSILRNEDKPVVKKA